MAVKAIQEIPLFITLIGNTSVGKSYYLFSLGLALKRNRPLRGWEVISISDDYKRQIEKWKKEHQTSGKLGATTPGTNLQLSFILENMSLKHRYMIMLADMAGEEIRRYFQPEETDEAVHIRLRQEIEMRIHLSSAILLMMDAKPFISNQFDGVHRQELDAWEALLQTKIFHAFEIVLMKAHIVPDIRDKLEKALNTLRSHGPQPTLLDEPDEQLEENAKQAFNRDKTSGILMLLKKQQLHLRFSFVSSIGMDENESLQTLDEAVGEFLSYNVLKPILNTVEAIENGFQKGVWAQWAGWCKNQLKWKSFFRKAINAYRDEKFSTAYRKLFPDKLHKDVRQYYPVLMNFSHTLHRIHDQWLDECRKYDEFLLARDNKEPLDEILRHIIAVKRGLIDRKMLAVRKNEYLQKVIMYFEESIPRTDNDLEIDYSRGLTLLHRQHSGLELYIVQRKQRNRDSLQENEYIQDVQDLQKAFLVLLIKQAKQISQDFYQMPQDEYDGRRRTLLNMARALALYLSIWRTGTTEWEKKVKPLLIRKSLRDTSNTFLNYLEAYVKQYRCYAVPLQYIKHLERLSQEISLKPAISHRMLRNTYYRVERLRIKLFIYEIPPIESMRKKHRNYWCFNDRFFEHLVNEWEEWEGKDFKDHRLLRFPKDLYTCPQCVGSKTIDRSCECLSWGWWKRLFKDCNICQNKRYIKMTCSHCNGRGQRLFAA